MYAAAAQHQPADVDTVAKASTRNVLWRRGLQKRSLGCLIAQGGARDLLLLTLLPSVDGKQLRGLNVVVL
jgi:hypothetical protein